MNKIIDLIKKGKFRETYNLVEALSHDERRLLQKQLESLGITKAPRNIYFDYKKQVWI